MDLQDFKNCIYLNELDKIKESFDDLVEDYKKELLLYASINGNLETIKYFLDIGLDIDAKDDSDNTLIYNSLRYYTPNSKNLEVSKFLFEQGASVDIYPKYSNFGILGELSNKSDQYEFAKKIIDKITNFSAGDLEIILHRGKFDMYKYILSHKKVSATLILDSIKGLFSQSNDNPLEFIKYLLDNNFININELNSKKETLLTIITSKVNSTLIPKYLIENGANIDFNDTGITCLFSMASKSNLEGVKYFLSKSVDINTKSSNSNKNALHYETERYIYDSKKELELPQTFKYLVDNGIDITLVDNSNKLPLHYLNENKRSLSIKYIFESTINQIVSKISNENNQALFDTLFSIQEIAGNKKEKDLIIDSLSLFSDFADSFLEQLWSEKVKLRELAVSILIKLNNSKYHKALKERSEVESNKRIFKILEKYLKK
jgi:ankyrin repeat protein